MSRNQAVFNKFNQKAEQRRMSKIAAEEVQEMKPTESITASDFRVPGSLMNMTTPDGANNIGSILEFIPDYEGDEYVVAGFYTKDELSKAVETMDNENKYVPKLRVVISKVVDGELEILTVDDKSNEAVLNAVFDLAKDSESIDDRVRELMDVSFVNLISTGAVKKDGPEENADKTIVWDSVSQDAEVEAEFEDIGDDFDAKLDATLDKLDDIMKTLSEDDGGKLA